MKFGIVKEWR